MASYSKQSMERLEEESEDLSMCCVCLESYDKLLRKPKYLPCYQTYCLQCIQVCTSNHHKHPQHPEHSSILNSMEDVEAIMALLTDVSGNWSEAIEKRQQIKEFLLTATAFNDEGLQKLSSLAEKEQLSVSKIGAINAKKKIEETMKQVKEEAENANKMWNDLIGNGKVNF